jgi:hypothetical protein
VADVPRRIGHGVQALIVYTRLRDVRAVNMIPNLIFKSYS